MNAWRRRFVLRVVSTMLAAQLPSMALFAWWFSGPLGRGAAIASSLTLHLALSLVVVRKLVFFRDAIRSPWWIAWLIETPYTAFMSGAFLAFAPCVAVMGLAWIQGVSAMPLLARVHLVAWLVGLFGSTVGRSFAVVTRREIRVPGLPVAFDGLRVAQLSDLHCGPYLPRWIYARWAATTSSLSPDLIALTGDLITSGEGYLDDVREFVGALRARHGVVACMGNHDYFGTETGVVDALAAAGVRLLRNEGFPFRRGESTLWIAAVDDRWTRRDDLSAALSARPEGSCVVLLAHDPASFPEAAREGVALTLSGHTHGGQFGLPGRFERINLARMLTRYSAGIFREGASTLFVHRGIGTTGPPVRVGMWPEIALLTLRAA